LFLAWEFKKNGNCSPPYKRKILARQIDSVFLAALRGGGGYESRRG
jgi:hypothetical protein